MPPSMSVKPLCPPLALLAWGLTIKQHHIEKVRHCAPQRHLLGKQGQGLTFSHGSELLLAFFSTLGGLWHLPLPWLETHFHVEALEPGDTPWFSCACPSWCFDGGSNVPAPPPALLCASLNLTKPYLLQLARERSGGRAGACGSSKPVLTRGRVWVGQINIVRRTPSPKRQWPDRLSDLQGSRRAPAGIS